MKETAAQGTHSGDRSVDKCPLLKHSVQVLWINYRTADVFKIMWVNKANQLVWDFFINSTFFCIIIKQWGDLLSMQTDKMRAIESEKRRATLHWARVPLWRVGKYWTWGECEKGAWQLSSDFNCPITVPCRETTKPKASQMNSAYWCFFFSAKNRQVPNADSQVSSNQSLAMEDFSYLETERVVNSQIWP